MVEPKKERLRIRATPWKKPLAEQTLDLFGEPPAYVKRALRVENAERALFQKAERCYLSLKRFVDLRRMELEAVAGHEKKERRAKRRLLETIERCNARWRKWLDADDRFDAVNREIDGYNEHYVQERQAALKYVPLWAAHVDRKPPMGPNEVLARFPLW